MAREADGGRGGPCILVLGEAAEAADLITGLIFKHLEQNLAGRAPGNALILQGARHPRAKRKS